MSQDEIVFEEVRYREPERRCRPDRDRQFACLAYEVPGPDDLPIYLDRATADVIERHALRDTSVELGGILLGKECLDDQTGQPFVWVTRSLEAKHYENTQASFTYTHESWEEISRERDRLHPELDIVGWYHTHPDFGVFLSGHDLFIHRHFFAQPLQVAYVVDPIRQTRGFFQWSGDNLAQVGGYLITASRGDRIELARLVNDLENIPNTDGGGGGLSPRLEAELIAMLTRPAPAHTTTADRTLAAMLFALFGVLAGVIGVLAVLWLNQFATSVQDQNDKLDRMAASVDRSSAAQRLALESLLSASTSKGHTPDTLVAGYEKTTRDLDEARQKLDRQETINDTMAARARALEAANSKLANDLELTGAHAAKYEADAKETPELRKRVDDLEEENGEQKGKLQAQEKLVATIEGRKVADVLRRYDRAWFAAVAGWGAALLLTLALLAALAMRAPLGPRDEPHGLPPESGGMPPHQIS